jgi:capsular exopolysaccharide synthesis family protein
MESKEIQINFKDEIFKYLLYWKWIALSILIALIVCFFYLRYASDVYQTSAKVQILDQSSSAFKLPSQAVSIFGDGKSNLENEIEIIKSSRIVGAVVDSLNLNTSIHSVGKIKSVELWDKAPFYVVWATERDSINKKSISFQITITQNGYEINGNDKEYKFGQTNFDASIPFKLELKNNRFLKKGEGNTYLISLKEKDKVSREISNNLVIDYVGNQSEILKISLNGNNINKINDVVNMLIQVFNQDGINDRQQVFKKTIEFVDERFKYLFNELDSIETVKADYKISNGISYVEADAGQLMKNNYESQAKVESAKAQIALSGLMIESINKSKGLDLLPSNIGIESNEVNGLVSNYNEIILKRNKLIASGGGENNPMVKDVTNQAFQIKNNIKASIIGFQNALATNKNELSRISSLETSKYSKVPTNEKAIRSIERQQSIKETLYILLLQKREEAAVNLAIINPSIKVVENAIYTPQPIAPNRKIILLTAFLIGLLIPIGVIYLYYLSNNKIQSKEDIEAQITNIPIIAEIPFIEAQNKVIRYLDRSVLSESFRILRTNLNFINHGSKKSSVLFVTSTIKGEGKTFVSLNLAISLSSIGKKVIIIGADLRNPQLHKKLEMDRGNAKGVTNFLYDDSTKLEDIKVSNTKLEKQIKFDIIFSGSIPPNPAELLSNGRFELLLEELKKDYDYIIVDTAPTLLVTDTTLITHLADTVIYVTRANFTEKKLLNYISKLKSLNSIQNIGFILNNVGQNKGYGYSYRYSYNYGYGYGYDNDYDRKTSWFFKLKKAYRNTIRRLK